MAGGIARETKHGKRYIDRITRFSDRIGLRYAQLGDRLTRFKLAPAKPQHHNSTYTRKAYIAIIIIAAVFGLNYASNNFAYT